MNPVFNMDAATLSPVALFLQADVVVKIVMVGLLSASVWCWSIIVDKTLLFRRTRTRKQRRGGPDTLSQD